MAASQDRRLARIAAFRAAHPDTAPTFRPRKHKRVRLGDTQSRAWQRLKNGDAIDGRGDRRSAKRLLRKQACAAHGVATGRKWKRLRIALRRAGVEA